MGKKLSKKDRDNIVTLTCLKMYFSENPEKEREFYQWIKDNDRARDRIIFALNEMDVKLHEEKESIFSRIKDLIELCDPFILGVIFFCVVFFIFICFAIGLEV